MLVYWKSCTIVAWCFVFGGRAKETAYDLITRICAAIIGIPIVLVSLVAEEFGNFGWWENLPEALCITNTQTLFLYGIFPYIWLICMVNVGEYTIQGACGIVIIESLSKLDG